MSALPKDFIQEILQENDFKNLGEIMTFLKKAFKDVLQEMLELKWMYLLDIQERIRVVNRQTIVEMGIQPKG